MTQKNNDDGLNEKYLMANLKEYENKTTSSFKFQEHAYPPYKCRCQYCEQIVVKKDQPAGDYSLDSDLQEIVQSKNEHLQSVDNDPIIAQQSEFSTLVQRLMPSKVFQRTPLVNIQDSVFYQNKEAYLMIYNHTDETSLQFVTQKDKLSQFFLVQFLLKRRQQYEIKTKLDEMTATGKLQSTTDQQAVEAIRKIKQRMNLLLAASQYVHIFYNTQETSQIVSQPEFNFYMERRKTDVFWTKMQFIQGCSIDKTRLYEVRYWHDKEQDTELFKLAKDDTNNYLMNQNYQQSKLQQKEKGFIDQLKKDSREQYLSYICFKLCVYAEKVNNTRIKRCIFQFAKSTQGHYFLVNCKQLVILNVEGIRHQPFFQYYVNNYSEKEQLEIIAEFEQKLEQKKVEEEIKKSEYLNKYQIPKKGSGTYNIVSQFIKDDCDYLNKRYIVLTNEQYAQFDRVEDKALTQKDFHKINSQAENEDFYDLLYLGKDKTIDSIKLLKKQALFANFSLEQKRFVKQIEYQKFKTEMDIQRDKQGPKKDPYIHRRPYVQKQLEEEIDMRKSNAQTELYDLQTVQNKKKKKKSQKFMRNSLASPISHLIKNQSVQRLMSTNSPLIGIFGNGQFNSQQQFDKSLPQLIVKSKTKQ